LRILLNLIGLAWRLFLLQVLFMSVTVCCCCDYSNGCICGKYNSVVCI